jgi:Kef-type K+ transport system membrane component KefB
VVSTAVEGATFLHIVLSLGILLFASKLFAELFHRIKMPIVLGELLAGIVVGPKVIILSFWYHYYLYD